ncbi:MAG: hypothetical protein JSU96_12425 [Acidobacteriota bacterium]|nr:MAG: hypothetical protein JSU96_12425 [Acidobacteriota bacterium]
MKKNRIASTSLLLTFLFSLFTLWAGGPNVVNPGDGFIFRWDPTKPVMFTIDQGPLGRLSNADAAKLVRDQTAKWTDVATSTIEFSDTGQLPVDVTGANWEDFFGVGEGQQYQFRPENPVIFDTDGSITDDILGEGASDGVLGFAGIRSFKGPYFHSGWAVLNGIRAGNNAKFKHTVVHELGHFLGLDHTQNLQQNADEWQSFPCGEVNKFCSDIVPLMYPFQMPRVAVSPGPLADDVAWISWLYPTNDFQTTTGTIKGTVYRRSGAGFQGANVVAVPLVPNGDGTFTERRSDAISVVSDFLQQATGEYEIPGLPPGDYYVYIEPLNPAFTVGSGVGPFDQRPTNFPKDYYDEADSVDEDPTLQVVIHVEAGETISGIDMTANEVFAIFDGGDGLAPLKELGDDDEINVVFPEGFRFPFYGAVYSEVSVNSDGNLTFQIGDGKVGDARTESRFLSGPPRIAPFFSDMDPSVGGEIKGENGEGWVKFTWDRVPEWDAVPAGAPNTFSVTLFSTGDIRFEYGEISATPDVPSEDYPQQGLLSVVGIAPGGESEGTPEDLSPGQFGIPATAVYQVFPGVTFDLEGQTIDFNAASSQLLFPLLRGDAEEFTGFAVTNYGDAAAALTVEGRALDGSLADFPTNPASDSVLPQTQMARLGREFFDVPMATPREGWVRMLTSEPELASFFLFGNGTSRLDGSVAVKQPSTQLFFTRLYNGPAVFPTFGGLKDAVTTLALANPNEVDSVTVTLKLFSATGNQIGLDAVRQLAPLGGLFEPLASLFSIQSEKIRDGYVAVSATGDGVIGFELISLDDTLMGFNASPSNGGKIAYSAQLAHASNIFTSVKLVNPTANTLSVTATALITRADGGIDQRVSQVTVVAGNSLQLTVDQLFGLPGLPTSPIVGSMKFEASDVGLIGDVIFGDPNAARYAAALPLQFTPFKKAVYSQVSNATSSIRALNAFTGLAFFNPSASQDARITVSVFDRDGVQQGDSTEVCLGSSGSLANCVLKPGQRVSPLLIELIPETKGLVRGYIIIESTIPVISQELFGNLDLDYLSAVPPHVVE